MMDDRVSLCIGDTGRWQKKTALLLTLLKFLLGWNNYIMVFYSPPQKFWCRSSRMDMNHSDILEENRCITVKNSVGVNRSYLITTPCTNFTYDTSVYTSTIVSEWNLVCDDAFLVELSQIIVLVGFTLGGLLFGYIGDKYGRRKPLIANIALNIIGQLFVTYSPSYLAFIITRFIVALSSGGIGIISFVLCTEIFGGKWRTIVSTLFQIPFAMSIIILPILSYYIRDWRNLQGSIAILSLLYIPHIWLMPESPRWLLAINRKKELIEMLEKIAIINNMKKDAIKNVIMTESAKNECVDKFRHILKKEVFTKKSLFLWIIWFGQGICSYGFVLNSGNVSSNLFLIIGISSVSSVSGIVVATVLTQYITHRMQLAISYVSITISLFLMLCVPNDQYIYDWPRILLSIVTVISLAISTTILYIYTGELYPTLVRNSMVGVAVLLLKIGGCVSPLLLTIGRISNFIPITIMGIISLLMIPCLYPLPETKRFNASNEDINSNMTNIKSYQKVNTEETIN